MLTAGFVALPSDDEVRAIHGYLTQAEQRGAAWTALSGATRLPKLC